MFSRFAAALLVLLLASPAAAQGVYPYQLEAIDSPADQECACLDLATGKFEWLAGGGGGGSGHTIKEEGTPLTQRDGLNCIGAAITCSDDSGNNETEITIAPAFSHLSGTATDAQIPNTITIDLASAATALASNPSDCSSNTFANAIAASGNLTCSAIGDSDVPNSITIDLAAAATALASNPSDCSSNQFANAIAASGNLTCSALADADIPDTITASNYLPLAGGTMTGSIVTDNLGIEFAESDTNPSCGAGEYHIYADLSENLLKKCNNGSTSNMDTGGTDTGPSPDCSGTSTYQDGEGNCDTVGGDLSGPLDALEIDAATVGIPEIATDGVDSAEIAANAVGSSEIATNAVDAAEIVADAVGSSEIAADAVTASEIATDAVTTTEILDNTIAAADIATSGVATAEILDATITADDIATSAVATAEILDATITADDIATSAVATAEILDATIVNGDISASAAISTSKLALTLGDFLTLSTDDVDWDGVRIYSSAADMSNRTSLEWTTDFSATTQSACVGADEGETCSTNTDCGGGTGVCTADKNALWALDATVYRSGTTINATDLPLTGTWDFGGGTRLEVPNSTSSASTTAGTIHLDTNGSTATVPMVTVSGTQGDGSTAAALPTRSCWRAQAFLLSTTNIQTTPLHITPGNGNSSLQHAAAARSGVPLVLSNLVCELYEDLGASEDVTFLLETGASGAATNNATKTYTWSSSGLTCAITGSGSADEFRCSDLDTKVTISTSQAYHIKISATTNPTWASGIGGFYHCSWMECADAVW